MVNSNDIRFESRTASGWMYLPAVLLSLILSLSVAPAVAKGKPDSPGVQGLENDLESHGLAKGRTVVFVGLNGVSTSHFRIANLGRSAGHVTVNFRNGATGDEAGTWNSVEIQAHGAIEVALADMAADVLPPVNPLGRATILKIRASFNGHVQHLVANG